MPLLLLLLTSLFGARVNYLSGQSGSLSPFETQSEEIDSMLLRLSETGDFNGNVLVYKAGVEIYSGSYGFTDSSKTQSLTDVYRFGIGSIYKEIPAILIMQLEEVGKLETWDPVSKYVAGLPVWAENITILQLLQYTSGLPTVSWGSNDIINNDVLLNSLRELDNLQFTPGTDYLYTNYSPFLLSKIIEKITNSTYREAVVARIFKPFSLDQSIFAADFPYTKRDSMAIPFNDDFVEDVVPFSVEAPIFLLTMTTRDLRILIDHLHAGNLINHQSLFVLATTPKLKNDRMQTAIGNPVISGDKVIKHTHHGSSGNYECLIHRDNETETTVIVLTNRKKKNVYNILDSILRICS